MAQRDDYTATASQTLFTYTFQIYQTSEIQIYVNGVLLTETTDYTVTIETLPTIGGTFTLVLASTVNDAVSAVQNIPVTRLTTYATDGDWLAATVNADFNRIYALLTQEVPFDDINDRLVKFSNTEDRAGKTNLIPSPVTDEYLVWNSSGELENQVAPSAAPAAASAAAALVSENAAAASASAASTSETNAATSETNAAASAAGVNLPSITGGDAAKILKVNSGETAYELASTDAITVDYISDLTFNYFDLSAPTLITGELTNTSQTSSGDKFIITPLGTQAIIVDGATLWGYTLSTAWDMSTASYATDTIVLSEPTTADGISFNTAASSALGTVTLTGGAGSVDGITVNSVEIMSGAVSYTSTLNNTADLVAQNINAHTSSPNYTAYNDTGAGGSAIVVITADTAGTGSNTYDVTTTGSGGMGGTDVDLAYGVADSGKSMIIKDGADAWRYTLTTAYDISTATYNTNDNNGLLTGTFYAFSQDGLKLFTYDVNGGTERVAEYPLTSAFAPTSATIAGVSYLDISTEVAANTVLGMDVSVDGTKLLIMVTGAVVYRYDMTAFDISTGSYSGHTSSVGTGDKDLQVSPNGIRLYKQDADGLSQTRVAIVRPSPDY